MNWEVIRRAADDLVPVAGGHTVARRGLVKLPDGRKVFVKLAVDDQTAVWLQQELTAYHWLEAHHFHYAPELLAEGSDGFALPDLSDWDWSDRWTEAKLAAAFGAMDSLANLSTEAADDVDSANFGDNPWLKAPQLIEPYILNTGLGGNWIEQLEQLFSDTERCSYYQTLADTEPWRGTQLVHYDVRADNYAYHANDDKGLLIDWNWLSLGSTKLDQTALLINVAKSGFKELVAQNNSRLDTASLAWFVGFCLKSAAGPADSPRLRDLRMHQLQSALVADQLAKQRLGFATHR